jgi:RNA polymerase sigma-70 factor (ECF subfamily)
MVALVTRAQAGESDAYAEIYAAYHGLIFRYVRARVRGHHLAEDITADVFTKALDRIHAFTWQGRDFGAWLVIIARNRILDHLKSARYRLELSTGDTLPDRPTPAESNPEAAVLAYLSNLDLLTALGKISREQRDCLTLRFLRDLSVSETARAMGKSVGAIKALQYRAVRSLARLLHGSGGE